MLGVVRWYLHNGQLEHLQSNEEFVQLLMLVDVTLGVTRV